MSDASALPTTAVPPVAAAVSGGRKRGVGIAAWLSAAWLALMVLVALFGSFLNLDQHTGPLTDQPMFSKGHIFGTDGLGHDLFARLVLGTRSSMFVAFGAVIFGTVIGGFLGLVAGFFRGRLTNALGSLFDVLLAYPPLVLSLTLVSVFANQPSVSTFRRELVVMLGLGVVAIPILARITRANTVVWAEREFVTAARAMGAGQWRILFRDVLPNVVPAMLSISLLGVGVAVVAESGLAFLGVGVKEDLTSTSWGNILTFGKNELNLAPHIEFITVIVLLLTVMALNFLGDVLRSRFDVRESVL